MPKRIKSEDVNVDFSNLIREKMSSKEFWKWVAEWYDPENIIEIAENWEEGLKRDIIEEYNEEKKEHPNIKAIKILEFIADKMGKPKMFDGAMWYDLEDGIMEILNEEGELTQSERFFRDKNNGSM